MPYLLSQLSQTRALNVTGGLVLGSSVSYYTSSSDTWPLFLIYTTSSHVIPCKFKKCCDHDFFSNQLWIIIEEEADTMQHHLGRFIDKTRTRLLWLGIVALKFKIEILNRLSPFSCKLHNPILMIKSWTSLVVNIFP